MASTCDLNNTANTLYTELASDLSITVPTVDTSITIPAINTSSLVPITTESLTTTLVNGNGVFDLIAKAVSNQLLEEYKAQRINGAEYSKIFASLMEAALSNAVTFILQRDGAYYQNQLIAAQVAEQRLKAEAAKLELTRLQLDIDNSKMIYATNKMKLVEAQLQACSAKFNLDEILPKQSTLLTSQIGDTNSGIALKLQQKALTTEQVESQRAQTMDTRTDGTPITGSIGKQNALVAQQTDSFKKDSQLKAAKIFSDAWVTALTVDSGTETPSNLANAKLNEILATIITDNNLV